ncbi:CHAP domain-containing protein [Roseomonas sp. CCTCC AB2023176]|uniref:CHAP domain-containing protein n=1 Tax=Roseomonas sp. CCTCC AB2023176 TaxID=3342640 RepID=UPI0035E392E9
MQGTRGSVVLSVACGAFFALSSTVPAHAAPNRGSKPVAASRSAAPVAAVRTPASNRGAAIRPVADRQSKPTGAKPGRGVASRRGGEIRFASFSSGHASRGAAAEEGGFGYISCVPYARMVTGMDVSGNGGQWWYNAAGVYARGQRPEPGSVLAFRSYGGMSAGHVAVVERILSPREITIHHANWGGPGIRRGSVMRNVSVLDVSEANDWTAVRVQVGHDTVNHGRVYPTFGFIHNRLEAGGVQMVRARRGGAEVAEATPHLRFINTSVTLDGSGN